MKILEKFGISLVAFLLVYAFISVGSRMLKLTNIYLSHMYGGIIATIFSIALLMYLLLKKANDK